MSFPGRKPRLWACLLTGVLLCPARMHAQVNVQIGQNFTATTYVALSGTGLPPDPDGAIGPSQFVEFINGEFSVFNLTNVNNPIRMVDVDFWSGAGVTIPGSDAVTDPRVIYDSVSHRWFASMVDVNATASDPTSFANHFLFAVSATSNPLGTWAGFRFLADPDNGYFADFPTMGVDSNAVYISGDMFQSSVELAASLVSIPKSDLLGATPTIANRTFHGDLDYGVRGMVLQAATCFDGTSTGNILSVENLGTDSSFYSNIVNFTVLNGNTPSASLSTPTNLTGPPYMVPDNADQGVPLFTPIQPDGTTMLAGNDARFCGRVYCVGGVIYAVHNTEVNGKMAIVWYRVSAATHKLLESGTITNSDLDLFFPAIAANANGTIIVTCNGCSLNSFVSCFAIAGQTAGGVTTFGSPVLLQAGVISYHGDDEVYIDPFEGLPPLSRWGDYSTISVDPNNANNFWIIEMYPSDSDNNDVWSTQVIQVLTTPAAALTISEAGTNVMIAWPNTATGFQLQAETNLSPASGWTNMPQTVSSNASQFFVLAPIAKGNQYFRLFHP
jgi:hypothetical protein